MKKLMYIFLALPILTGCKEKKSTGAMGGMPTPEISVTKPIVKDITLTKDYPGYLTTELQSPGKSCGQSKRDFAVHLLYSGRKGKERTVTFCHRAYII